MGNYKQQNSLNRRKKAEMQVCPWKLEAKALLQKTSNVKFMIHSSSFRHWGAKENL